MHLERGSAGTVIVFVLPKETSVVRHAFESLRNGTISGALPIYLREVCGEKQICADCTGLFAISEREDAGNIINPSKRNKIRDFLAQIIKIEDEYVSNQQLIIDTKYIFINEKSGDLFWTCIPVVPQSGTIYAAGESISERLKKVLEGSFFASVIPEDIRNGLVNSLSHDNETEFLRILDQFADTKPTGVLPEDKPKTGSRIRLLTLIGLLALLATAAIFIQKDVVSAVLPSLIPVLVFLLGSVLFAVVLHISRQQNKTAPQERENASKKDNALFCPSVEGEHKPWYPDAFLEEVPAQKAGSGNNQAKRYPILVNDFLIGSDALLCDLFLEKGNVSHRHARILKRGETYFIMDIGSSVGTVLGDERLYSHEEYPLSDNDRITVGENQFRFRHYSTKGGL